MLDAADEAIAKAMFRFDSGIRIQLFTHHDRQKSHLTFAPSIRQHWSGVHRQAASLADAPISEFPARAHMYKNIQTIWYKNAAYPPTRVTHPCNNKHLRWDGSRTSPHNPPTLLFFWEPMLWSLSVENGVIQSGNIHHHMQRHAAADKPMPEWASSYLVR